MDKEIFSDKLVAHLELAMEHCHDGSEEQGGFILAKDDTYWFIKIKNANTGTKRAAVLYTADKQEFGEKVITYLMKGWEMYASFHTHPNGYSTNPSDVDLTQLFRGHKRNFIYGTKQDELVMYSKNSDEDVLYQILTNPEEYYGPPLILDAFDAIVDREDKVIDTSKCILWQKQQVPLKLNK